VPTGDVLKTPSSKKDKRGSLYRPVMLLCSLAYFASYVTRINYKVIISAIESTEGLDREGASLALTGLFITYGLGQLVSGWFGDRIKPRYLIFSGLLVAVAMNLIMPLYANPVYMLVIWCINGFGQAMMWPPILKTLSTYLKGSDYVKATVRVSWASAIGTIVMYLIAPLIIELSSWQYVFIFSAIVGVVSAAVFLPCLAATERSAGKTAESSPEKNFTNETSKSRSLSLFKSWAGLIAVSFCAIAFQGMLRDVVDTWMPSYISEIFKLGTSVSILTGVILPTFTIICHQAASMVYNKIRDESISAGMFFGVATIALLVLSFISKTGKYPIITIACFALISGCMHAINLILVCILPKRFAKYGLISTLSGFFNFSTYVGSALSIYGFAALSQRIGWSGTVVAWTVVSLFGASFCFIMHRPLNKHSLSEKMNLQEKTQ